MTTATVPALVLARQSVDRAVSTHNAAAAKLYHPDGQPVYTDTDARKQRLLEPVQKAADDASKIAEEVRLDAHKKRLSAYADPIAALNVIDLERAFYRRQFVADDCASMPLADLAQRVEAVAVSGDTVGRTLYAVYARRRWDAELAAQRKAGTNAPNPPMVALGAVVASLEAATQPDRKALDAEAAAMEKAAWELQLYAGRELANLDGSSASAYKVRL